MSLDPSVFVHERALCESDEVGARTRIWAFAHVLPGVELHAAVGGEKAAAACVKGFIIFHADDGSFHGVQGRSAAFQNVPALGQRLLDAYCVGFHHVVRNGPCAAMDYDYRELSQ